MALLGVKNEAELIASTVHHMLSIGVDHVIVCDYGSTDGTANALERFRTHGQVTIVNGRQDALIPEVAGAQRLAIVRDARADWAIFLDSDEFWLPATGSIKDCLPDSADIVSVRRYNVPVVDGRLMMPATVSRAQYHQVHLSLGTIGNFKTVIDLPDQPAWLIGADIMPKVMLRPGLFSWLAAGDHDAAPIDNVDVRRAVSNDIVIAHVPFTSYERFERKVATIAETIKSHPDFFVSHGWHWVRWTLLRDAGKLREEFDRQIISRDQFRQLVDEGLIRTAAQVVG